MAFVDTLFVDTLPRATPQRSATHCDGDPRSMLTNRVAACRSHTRALVQSGMAGTSKSRMRMVAF
jgi:hypothetical protein